MRHDPSFGPAGGVQRLFWLIPAAFLLGVPDSEIATTVCAAVLIGAAWQVVYRRPLASRLIVLSAAVGGGLLLRGAVRADWSAGVGGLTALMALMALGTALAGTELALRALDHVRGARSGRAVPAGT